MNVCYRIKYFSVIAFICSGIFLASCSSSKKAASATKHFADSLPSLPLSEIDIPLKIYAPPILAKAEKVVPKEFASDGWPNYIQQSCDFRYKYRFVRSGLTISCTNNNIGIQFTGNYQLSGSRCICT